MLNTIYAISMVVKLSAKLLALVIGTAYCYRHRNSSYLRIIPIYLLFSVATEVLGNTFISKLLHFQLFGDYQDCPSAAMYNLYTPFEPLILTWFLIRVIRSALIGRAVFLSVLVYGVYGMIYSCRFGINSQPNVFAISLESAVVILPCLWWYRELFSRNESLDLVSEPAFWLVTGIFFYLATNLLFFMGNFCLTSQSCLKVTVALSSISNFLAVVTYILFTMGFICQKERLEVVG